MRKIHRRTRRSTTLNCSCVDEECCLKILIRTMVDVTFSEWTTYEEECNRYSLDERYNPSYQMARTLSRFISRVDVNQQQQLLNNAQNVLRADNDAMHYHKLFRAYRKTNVKLTSTLLQGCVRAPLFNALLLEKRAVVRVTCFEP